MIELKISGEKPEEFYANALRMFALIANGLRRDPFTAPAPQETQASYEFLKKDAEARQRGENIDGSPRRETLVVEDVPGAVPLENPKASDPPPEEKPAGKKRGPKPKQAEVKPATVHDDPIPSFLQEEKKPGDDDIRLVPGDPATSLEECREALRQVFAGFEQRARAAKKDYASLSKADLATFEGEVMRDKVAYAKPLLAEFGVAKLSELKPEQFAKFVAAAQPYVAGEA